MSKKTWTDEELKIAVLSSKTWRSVYRKIGLSNDSSKSVKRVKNRVNELGLDCSHFLWKRSYDEFQLRKAVSEVKSYYRLLIKLGKNGTGNAYYSIKKAIKKLDIDVSHFDCGKSETRGNRKKVILDDVLIIGSHITTTNLKRLLYKNGIKKPICEICGIDNWRGFPVPTELDHINGTMRIIG